MLAAADVEYVDRATEKALAMSLVRVDEHVMPLDRLLIRLDLLIEL